MTGTVKKYFDDKGFGFITPESGEKDIFVHVKAIKSGADRMREGAEVEYEVGKDKDGRARAVRVVVMN